MGTPFICLSIILYIESFIAEWLIHFKFAGLKYIFCSTERLSKYLMFNLHLYFDIHINTYVDQNYKHFKDLFLKVKIGLCTRVFYLGDNTTTSLVNGLCGSSSSLIFL